MNRLVSAALALLITIAAGTIALTAAWWVTREDVPPDPLWWLVYGACLAFMVVMAARAGAIFITGEYDDDEREDWDQ